MGEFTKTLVVKIKANSGASDAAIHDYGTQLIADIKSYLFDLRYDSWRKEVWTDYEDSALVDFEIEVNEAENLQR